MTIGALRSLRLSALYVSGYVRGGAKFQGAQASHAWVSVFIPEIGWIDFDPTNDLIVSDSHVTLAWGRDYGDVTPVKGVTLGGGGQVGGLRQAGVTCRLQGSTDIPLASLHHSAYSRCMSGMIAENSPSAIWQRTIESKTSRLDPAAARGLLRLKLSRTDLKRANELAAKACAGTLSAAEERELEDYRAIGAALELLKSKARLSLKRLVR